MIIVDELASKDKLSKIDQFALSTIYKLSSYCVGPLWCNNDTKASKCQLNWYYCCCYLLNGISIIMATWDGSVTYGFGIQEYISHAFLFSILVCMIKHVTYSYNKADSPSMDDIFIWNQLFSHQLWNVNKHNLKYKFML